MRLLFIEVEWSQLFQLNTVPFEEIGATLKCALLRNNPTHKISARLCC